MSLQHNVCETMIAEVSTAAQLSLCWSNGMYSSNAFYSCCLFLFWKNHSFVYWMKLLKIPFCVIWFYLPITRFCSWNGSKHAAVVQHCRLPFSFSDKWNGLASFSHQNNNKNHQKQSKILFNLHLRCQAIQSIYYFHVYTANNMEIVLWIHSSENAAIDKNLNKSGKELS